MGVSVVPKPPLLCLLPALERWGVWGGNTCWEMGIPSGCAGARAPHGSCTLDALVREQQRDCVFQWLFQCFCSGSEFLTGMTCSCFLGCKQGKNKWHLIKTWTGGVRCRFGTRCPALLLPPLCPRPLKP